MKLFASEIRIDNRWKAFILVRGCFHDAHRLLHNYVKSHGYNLTDFRTRRVKSQEERNQYSHLTMV